MVKKKVKRQTVEMVTVMVLLLLAVMARQSQC